MALKIFLIVPNFSSPLCGSVLSNPSSIPKQSLLKVSSDRSLALSPTPYGTAASAWRYVTDKTMIAAGRLRKLIWSGRETAECGPRQLIARAPHTCTTLRPGVPSRGQHSAPARSHIALHAAPFVSAADIVVIESIRVVDSNVGCSKIRWCMNGVFVAKLFIQ